MTVVEMHVMFRELAQQMGMQTVRAILSEDIDTCLNIAVNDYIKKAIAIFTRLLPILCKPLKWYRIEISFWRLKKCQSTKTARRYGQRKKREKKNYENFCHCLMWRT